MGMHETARCSRCGAVRLAHDDGTPGVCSLIGCPDPFADLRSATPPEPDAPAVEDDEAIVDRLVGAATAKLGTRPMRPAAPAPEPDEAERVARELVQENYRHIVESDVSVIRLHAHIRDALRAAERRGWERACEEAAGECEAERSQHETALTGLASVGAPADMADLERYAMSTTRACARRIRALRERGPR